MAFRVETETLESLEWPRVVRGLADLCRTHQARERLLGLPITANTQNSTSIQKAPHPWADFFEQTLDGVHQRLAETDETRVLLDAGHQPPLGSTPDLTEALGQTGRGGVIELESLRDLKNVLRTFREMSRFLDQKADECPHLGRWADQIQPEESLESRIESVIGPDGEVRNDASQLLVKMRKTSLTLSGNLQKRLQGYLSDSSVTEHLSDNYFTLRNERYVLPVRSDSKSKVKGIVHDASRSGTTLFIEPEAVIDLNNRLKQSELTISREIQRILRELSQSVGEASGRIRSSLEALSWIDLAFARGRMSQNLQAHSPKVEDQGIFELPALRHPLIDPDECISNDIRIGDDFVVLVLSGPNAGGKTVCMKSIALACLFVRAGLHVACEAGARVDLVGSVFAEIGDHQDIGENLSTFSAHMANLAKTVQRAEKNAFIALDEIGVGTDPSEGSALAQSILERLAETGARVVTTTHYNLLKEMADVDPRFQNASVEFDAKTLAPTYRVKIGTPGSSSASAVAARMGMPDDVLERAKSLLDRDDRRLDQMLSELSTRRAQLEAEQASAARVRAEGEAARNEYRIKLEGLQERREKLFHSMRDDLDQAFANAHHEVADVIRELQRGPSSQQAAEARGQLLALEKAAENTRNDLGISKESKGDSQLIPIDWLQISVGDSVELALGGSGTLESLPDRKGRVGIRSQGKKLMMDAANVGLIRASKTKKASASQEIHVSIERAVPSETAGTLGGGVEECDLRGERVLSALSRLREVIDRAVTDRRDGVRIIHGIGTGALRNAIREELAGLDYAEQISSPPNSEGGQGVTLVDLSKTKASG
ncbi:MAG: hypothetical protein CL917_12315 [Deltaproteobacteria bacterium]|nr:hypothetical protein [Deltaproteobacteria bacterium]